MIATIDQLVQLTDARLQPLLQFDHNYSLDVLRLDKIHAIISGNKWFKLKYSLLHAIDERKKGIITAGGAYSNHIVATACACSILGMESIGIIRGEKPGKLSCTLQHAADWGMKFEFVSRSAFRDRWKMDSIVHEFASEFHFVEDGGKNERGMKGAEEILHLVQPKNYDYICCAIGTGTTMAGIIASVENTQSVIGVSCLKIDQEQNEFSSFFEQISKEGGNFSIIYDYHFGGYAKYNRELIQFMNDLYARYNIPTDFVYTGKLFYAIWDLVKKSYFRSGSRILLIHSGGLQGNCSLPAGTLLF